MFYNICKPGVDKHTESEQLIQLESTKVGFESKYLFRMIDAIRFNGWRCEQAFRILHISCKILELH